MIQNSVDIIKKSSVKIVELAVEPATKVKAAIIPTPKLPPMVARETLTKGNSVFKQGGKPLKRLLIVHSYRFDIDDLSDVVVKALGDIGLPGISVMDRVFDPRRNRLSAEFLGKGNPDCVLFVSQNKNDKNAYRDLKRICTDELRVPSQVVAENNLTNPKRALTVMMNVARQMAVKLGKCPWVMPFNPITKDTMVFGLDVCHSTPIHKSVVGIDASLDDTFGRFISDFLIQDRGKEVVADLRPFVGKALDKYRKKNGKYPKNILFLRDGVGDGQLFDVNDREVAAIRDTIQEKCKDAKLTFVVVKKHIRTRIFSEGRNPTPGTIVDSMITHPFWYDFFLVSHETRNGTVSPTHYNVLLDEIQWPKNELQSFIYYLCYQYYNWDGSISVPAPCQYAHKMAFLYGRTLLRSPDDVTSVPEELEDTLLQI